MIGFGFVASFIMFGNSFLNSVRKLFILISTFLSIRISMAFLRSSGMSKAKSVLSMASLISVLSAVSYFSI